MSEPTPLSAEELAWLSNSETFRDPDARWDTAWLRSALATIDAQATEIAALKEALEREKRSEWREGLVAVIDHEGNYLGCMGTMTWAVLAGKEAQG